MNNPKNNDKRKTMNLPDLTTSDFLAANDYEVGTIFPLLTITKVEKKKAPNGKGERACLTLEKAPKPWMCSSNMVLREMGACFGAKAIETSWVGCKVSLKVVGGVRRPDGTSGNAFRIEKLEKQTKGTK